MIITQPNIILIILDTLRADKTLLKSKTKDFTPTLRSLQEKSIYFEECISNYTWTTPSHISMFTGLYSTQNLLLSGNINVLSKRLPNLTEILKNLGYNTVYYSENPYINDRTGLSEGFNTRYDNWKTSLYIMHKSKKFMYFYIILGNLDLFVRKITKSQKILKYWRKLRFFIERAYKTLIIHLFWRYFVFKRKNSLNELDKFKKILKSANNPEPQYLFFNIMATHNPYIPIKEIFEYCEIKISDIKDLKDFFLDPAKYNIYINLLSKRLHDKKIKKIQKFYDACVLYGDLILKKILSNLEELKLMDNSYIIITSDHGEHLCDLTDHYYWNHGVFQSVYEPLIRVPLIIYNKNLKKQIIEEQVELKDLFHTILHIASNSNRKNKYLKEENSILHQIKNKSTPKYIFGEHVKNYQHIEKLLELFGKNI
ncbi:MAG: sulfatase-like hydrolase/transferase, partial [Promethearchaeota archaeon]